MICGHCSNFNMKDSPIKSMGLCKLEKWPFEKARTFSPKAPCNKGKFALADQNTIKKRERLLHG